MAEILHNLMINSLTDKVFAGISTPQGIDLWWTKTSEGTPVINSEYLLNFGSECTWKAIVTKHEINKLFELQLTDANDDWLGTMVGFSLIAKGDKTLVNFYHSGWRTSNDDYKFSSFCWAMYLRILKRNIEFGEKVTYEKRLSI